MMKQTYFREGYGTWTPWGTADFSVQFLRGVVFYSTPRHGGLRVSKRLGDKHLSEYAKAHSSKTEDAYWFEEDSDISIALYELSVNLDRFHQEASKFFSRMEYSEMRDSVLRHFPDYPQETISMV